MLKNMDEVANDINQNYAIVIIDKSLKSNDCEWTI